VPHDHRAEGEVIVGLVTTPGHQSHAETEGHAFTRAENKHAEGSFRPAGGRSEGAAGTTDLSPVPTSCRLTGFDTLKFMSADSPISSSTAKDGWKVTTATITACRVSFMSGGVDYKLGGLPLPIEFVVTFEYQVNGISYSGKMKSDTPAEPGHQFEISYNPSRPSRNTGSDFQITWFRFAIWVVGALIIGIAIYFENR
jgi:hypothetical protein